MQMFGLVLTIFQRCKKLEGQLSIQCDISIYTLNHISEKFESRKNSAQLPFISVADENAAEIFALIAVGTDNSPTLTRHSAV